MKLINVYAELRKLKLPVLLTRDVAVYFNIDTNHANKLLSRLAEASQLIHIKQGAWVFPDIDPLLLPCLITAPFPTYISLQTALYYHGMISQIPSNIYAVSLARTKVYQTPIANISIHHIQPSFFTDFTAVSGNELIKIATPEKALIDTFYLSQGKSRLFRTLPEVELPSNFKISAAIEIINNIGSPKRKTVVANLFNELVKNANHQQ